MTPDRSHITPHSAPRISGTARLMLLVSRPTTSTNANELAEASQQSRATTKSPRPAPITAPNHRRLGVTSQTTPRAMIRTPETHATGTAGGGEGGARAGVGGPRPGVAAGG